MTIDDAAENSFVASYGSTGHVWIGLSDIASEGTWVWDEDDSESTYTNWYSAQPDNALGGEHCAHTNYESLGKWNDGRCYIAFPFVCETYRLGATVKPTALPTPLPTAIPTTALPTAIPTPAPTTQPSSQPSTEPTSPTSQPSIQPTTIPSGQPSM